VRKKADCSPQLPGEIELLTCYIHSVNDQINVDDDLMTVEVVSCVK
jgi:hypothetical protein